MYTYICTFLSLWLVSGLGGQATAEPLVDTDVAIGSMVTIRHTKTGGYLHSNALSYPNGSKQQQVTVYSQKDANNDWQLCNITGINRDRDYTLYTWDHSPLEFVNSTMPIKLQHRATQKYLHSHQNFNAPVSDVWFQKEVTAYGMQGFVGDSNDDWTVEIDNESQLLSKRTPFRLRHRLTGCYLSSNNVNLPEWGLEQQEVTCNIKGGQDAHSLWFIEAAFHPRLQLPPPQTIPPPNVDVSETSKTPEYNAFLVKLWNFQQVVWNYLGLKDGQSCKDEW